MLEKMHSWFCVLHETTGGEENEIGQDSLWLIILLYHAFWLYESAINFNAATGESHLKVKTKQPTWRTKMQPEDMESNINERFSKMVLEQSV